ncbi:MAG: nucleotidyltransferase domain-containing protein [Actinomycetota bacterium]
MLTPLCRTSGNRSSYRRREQPRRELHSAQAKEVSRSRPSVGEGTVGSLCMSPAGWLPIVAELCALDPPVWVFGGIAEEALLEGSVTREHGDIDLLVDRNALSRHIERFEAIGYPSPQVYFEVVSGQPLVLGAERDGMPLEIGIFDEMESGRRLVRASDRDRTHAVRPARRYAQIPRHGGRRHFRSHRLTPRPASPP